MKIIDWDEVKKFIAERNPVEVDAGILEDWYWTAGTVFEEGSFREDNGAFIYSSWATPGFKSTMANGDVIEKPCYRETTAEDIQNIEAERLETRRKLREALDAIEIERTIQ